ncbi:hypothetical protein L3Q82_009231 [Scortum barcoo]|uniref:Uncharacterized protein n=1 Tax=Scortum barcoo TaxID=214431 RepID=A0ACB8WJG2_9TELE|nr:hypothetical protein L3Q82_009231 [Scortum barcoo]
MFTYVSYYNFYILNGSNETESTTHTSGSGSAAHPGWHINASCGKKVCCVCQRSIHSMEVLPGDVEEAVGGQQPSSRTATSAFVQGGTGGALPESLQNDLQQATNVHVSAQTVRNRLHEGGMRARRPQVGVVLTAQHRAGRLAFAIENTKIGKFATGALCSSQMKAGSH